MSMRLLFEYIAALITTWTLNIIHLKLIYNIYSVAVNIIKGIIIIIIVIKNGRDTTIDTSENV